MTSVRSSKMFPVDKCMVIKKYSNHYLWSLRGWPIVPPKYALGVESAQIMPIESQLCEAS